MDWRLYRDIYDVSLAHHWVGTLFWVIEQASIPFMVVTTVALWLLARPGGNRKWKLASASALGSAALALGVNRVIAAFWFRERPFLAHHISHPWINSRDASFPSDHASASFAIAFAVIAIDPLVGGFFLVCATVIALGRLFIGAHYPGDVLAGLGIGLVSALIVTRFAGALLARAVSVVERLTDPLLRPLWRGVETIRST